MGRKRGACLSLDFKVESTCDNSSSLTESPIASFSDRYPAAYHVVPLPLWRGILDEGALLPKAKLHTTRPTTDRIDRALGFANFVHLYLAQGEHRLTDLPILGAQLRPSTRPPFPHVVLDLDTSRLTDDECLLCNWNLAVSRPGVPGVAKGGNWTRGTRPERILEVWDAFRATNPTPRRARGFFRDARIPTLRGPEIQENLGLLSLAPRRMPELLLQNEIPLERFVRVIVFSGEDERQLRAAGGSVPVERSDFPGYDGDAVPDALRVAIGEHLSGEAPALEWDFDSIRPASD